jgi:hypothetical protein
MKTSTKASIYIFLIFLVTYIIVRLGIQSVFNDINTYVLAISAAVITIVLTPQKRIIRKQAGDQIQLKWIFSKKIIILK